MDRPAPWCIKTLLFNKNSMLTNLTVACIFCGDWGLSNIWKSGSCKFRVSDLHFVNCGLLFPLHFKYTLLLRNHVWCKATIQYLWWTIQFHALVQCFKPSGTKSAYKFLGYNVYGSKGSIICNAPLPKAKRKSLLVITSAKTFWQASNVSLRGKSKDQWFKFMWISMVFSVEIFICCPFQLA